MPSALHAVCLVLLPAIAWFMPVLGHAQPLSVSGHLSAHSPRWDRIKDNGMSNSSSGACDAEAADSYNDDVPYALIEFETSSAGSAVIQVERDATDLDLMLALYCNGFDPLAPNSALLAADDDGGKYPAARIQTALDGATRYLLVVSAYSNYAAFGGYRIVLPGGTRLPDDDGDGMPNGWERTYGLDPNLNDANLDADGDDLSNLREFLNGTEPRYSDSDGDGINDGADPFPKHNQFDINQDGVVDSRDLGALMSSWGQAGGAADVNGDDSVNALDLKAWREIARP